MADKSIVAEVVRCCIIFVTFFAFGYLTKWLVIDDEETV